MAQLHVFLVALAATAIALILISPGGLAAQHIPQLVRGEISDPYRAAMRPTHAVESSRSVVSSPRSVDPRSRGVVAGIVPPPAASGDVDEIDVALLWIGGLVGGAGGLALGILVGLEVHPSLDSPVWGGLAGYTVGVPMGVHLANRRRGNAWLTGLASVVPMGALVLGGGGGGGGALALAASLQIVGSAAVERFGERQRAEERAR